MNILIKGESFDRKIKNFIYQKQFDFRKEKGRVVSLETTVERLIREAYAKEIAELDKKNS